MKIIKRTFSSLLLFVAFVVPPYAFVIAGQAPGLPSRQPPPWVDPKTVPVVTIPSYSTVVPMLIYHDIAKDSKSPYTVTPDAFAHQMAALQRTGFRTISAAQMLGFLHEHQALSNRPLMIAFDDGLGSEWRTADPILAKYHMRAVVFMANHAMHGYYYLHPNEVQAMIKSGRWDIENHSDVKQYYRRNLVYRIRVFHSTRTRALLAYLRSLTPLPVGLKRMPPNWEVLGKHQRHRLIHPDHGVLTLRPRVKRWLQVFWAPRRTNHWQNYQLNIRISNLGIEGSGTSATVILAKYAVTLSAGRITVVGRHHWKGVIPEAPTHTLTVTMTRHLRVEVDGKLVDDASIPYTFGGISLGAWRTNAKAQYPTFSLLTVVRVP